MCPSAASELDGPPSRTHARTTGGTALAFLIGRDVESGIYRPKYLYFFVYYADSRKFAGAFLEMSRDGMWGVEVTLNKERQVSQLTGVNNDNCLQT